MANDFDQFPIRDNLINRHNLQMSDIWSDFMGTFFENLTGYLSQYGIFLPPVTTEQRDSIQSPQEGQTIYNSTLKRAQIFQDGTWTTYT